MQFIQSLSLIQESSALILPDLKKVMQKDKRVSPFLKRDSTFADLEDPKTSLETLKFYMLNNPNVIAHVKSRFNVAKNNLSKWDLDTFRKARNLEEKQFDHLKMVVQDIFKDHATLSRGTVSSDTMKELRSWANNSGRYYNLSSEAQRELSTIETLHPSKPIVVYRGLLFQERDFRQRSEYDKSEPNGVRFAKAIRANKKEVDLEWDRPSSWSKEKGVAQRFAMYGPASSNFMATFQMLSRKGAIDGKVGYIVSMLVDPKDVLIDFEKARATIGQFENEAEVIVKPGKYHCRIVKKFTPEGQVDVVSDNSETLKAISEIKRELDQVANIKTADLDVITNISDASPWKANPVPIDLLRNKVFGKAAVNSTTTMVLHLHDELLKHGKVINAAMKKISRDEVATDDELSKVYAAAKNFLDSLRASIDAESAESHRKTMKTRLDFERAVLHANSFYDSQEVADFKKLGDHLGVAAPSKTHVHQTTKPKQAAYIDAVMDKFFKEIGVAIPEDPAEKKTAFINLLKKAIRNHQTAKMIKNAVQAAAGTINKDRSWSDNTKL